MKPTFMLMTALFFIGMNANGQNSIPNGGFELWQDQPLSKPVYWNIARYEFGEVNQTTDAYKGNYAVELKTIPIAEGNISTFPGWISTEFPFTQQIDTLAFWYKYTPTSIDEARVFLYFKKNGANLDNSFGAYLSAAPTYTYMEFPFDIGQIPDTAQVEFMSSFDADTLTINGSVLKVDEVYFKSQPIMTSTLIKTRNNKLAIYPNPCNGIFTITSEEKNSTLEVINLFGQKIYSTQLNTDKAEIDLIEQPKGIYFYRVKSDKIILNTGRIIIE